jgi:hypothetical protein
VLSVGPVTVLRSVVTSQRERRAPFACAQCGHDHTAIALSAGLTPCAGTASLFIHSCCTRLARSHSRSFVLTQAARSLSLSLVRPHSGRSLALTQAAR